MEIAPDAHMGLVELSVSDLDRSLAYWQDAIGLRVLSRDGGTAQLGVDTPLVRFVEEPGARPADGFTGLFHVALLVPDRPSLGRSLAHTARERIPLTGLSDHVVPPHEHRRQHGDEADGRQPPAIAMHVQNAASREQPRRDGADQRPRARIDEVVLVLRTVMDGRRRALAHDLLSNSRKRVGARCRAVAPRVGWDPARVGYPADHPPWPGTSYRTA